MAVANARKPLASAAIIGSGAVALCAAVALKRALPKADIRVIDGTNRGGGIAESVLTIHPPALGLLARIGLEEDGLLRSGLASHALGDRFAGWSNAPFVVPFAEDEPSAMGVPLGLIERARTGRRDPASYSAAIALAEAGKFAPGSLHRTGAGEGVGYALSLDSSGFTALLRRIASQTGVIFAEHGETPTDVDLWLECDGRGSVLDGALSQDWGEIISGGEMLLWVVEGEPTLLNEYVARDWGWQASLSGPRTTQNVAVSNAETGAPAAPADARRLTFATGRLECPMEGRRVALGDGAAVPGPLGGFGFTLALMHLDILLDLMPGAEPNPLLEREYNRRAAIVCDEVRDFVGVLHTHSRHPGAFWSRYQESPAELPATRHFARSGRVSQREVDAVSDASWARALDALVEAQPGFDALARSVSEQTADAFLKSRRDAVAELVRSQMDYREWLKKEFGR